ncbi:MAG TPA: 2-amino-4-hydroxy-6-hydroxymethyldihydropteridine diphosphokinase [Campylobacterales bacterium]|nr:2-amino-4-hydroxy-6-hydroxymethyldihydropteridine diphosphokinase [Campylobacterales bacterium]
MKVNLSKNLTLLSTTYFPYLNKKKSFKKHTLTIGIGGNIGNVMRRFKQLYIYLKKSNNFDLVETSPILKNPPFGFIDQPDFYNGIIVLQTNLNPSQALNRLLRIEKKFKRNREFLNSPRTLDLDIIFFDKLTLFKRDLIIPHHDYQNRDSVMIPLSLIKSKI